MLKEFHRAQYRIGFADCDPAGILFFARHFDFAHRCLEAAFLAAGNQVYQDWYRHTKWIKPIRSAEGQYLAPLKSGDLIEVRAYVKELSESSVHFQFQIFQLFEGAQSPRVCAEMSWNHVSIQVDESGNWVKGPWPLQFLQMFKA